MDPNVRKVPVFVFPTSLKFFLNVRQSHRQLLTLYNPYDFPVKFKVLSTAPNKYAVIDPEGSMGPLSCVDIVIRHTFPMSGNCNITDKFRVIMQDHTTHQLLGRREIDAKLLPGEPDNISNDGNDNFQSLPQVEKNTDEHRAVEYPLRNIRSLQSTNSTNYIAIISGLVCILAMLLPTNQEVQPESKIPPYLHLSINLKLVFAYVLGLVSMVVFRP